MTARKIEIHSKWLDWTWTLGQLFQQPENKVVSKAIQKLRTKISGKFNEEIVLHKLETMAKENTTSHWTFTTPEAMIEGAIMCLLLLFCCWRICPSSGPTSVTYPAPSTPPAPPTIFNMTVNPIQR